VVGVVREARLQTPTARGKLKPGRQPHWNTILAGKAHLGWRRRPKDKAGSWVLRRYGENGYSVVTFARADDVVEPDGVSVLDYDQARSRALELIDKPAAAGRITVSGAMERYVDHVRSTGRSTYAIEAEVRTHIITALGKVPVADVSAAQIRRWHVALADKPSKRKLFDPPKGDELVRRRRSSANRTLAVLKAALNHCFDEGLVASNAEWGRKVKKFRNVDSARIRSLSVEEAKCLLEASDPDFRNLARAALETGCRYGELVRLEVGDFDARNSMIHVRKSKSGRGRHVALTPEGAEFFDEITRRRPAAETLLLRKGGPWNTGARARSMADAMAAAEIEPPASFHALRHTWASLSLMAGVSVMVVSKQLGHSDTRMVERIYGHLTRDFIATVIKESGPRFG
jgi:integrase